MIWKAKLTVISWAALATGMMLLGAFALFVWANRRAEAVVLPISQTIVPIQFLALGEPKVEDPDPGPKGALGVGDTRTIEFVAEPDDLGDNPAQREEHLRDWLMRALVAHAGLPRGQSAALIAALAADLADGARDRSPGLGPGPVRWIETAPGEALALIPHKDDGSRRAALARVADELAWKTHRLPQHLLVFEYQLDPKALLARVTRRAPLKGDVLFSAEFGYGERLVLSKADLRDFLGTVDDVVTIRDANNAWRLGIWVGGRRLDGRRPYGLLPGDALVAWEGFEKANNQVWQFGKWAGKEVGAFNDWSGEQTRAYQEGWTSKNEGIKERWFLGAGVDEEISEIERQASVEAENVRDSLRSRYEVLLVSLRQRRAEMEDAVRRAWADVPDAIRAGWKAVVIDR
jgi:hypothetical protein